MSFLVRRALPLLACALLIPNIVRATPITNLEAGMVDGVFIVNSHHSLSWEDVQILIARSDHGWHLGWFKDKESDRSDANAGTGSAGIVASTGSTGNTGGSESVGPGAAILSPEALPTLPGVTPTGDDATAADLAHAELALPADVGITAPEPATLVLFASGLLWMGRRVRRKTPGPPR